MKELTIKQKAKIIKQSLININNTYNSKLEIRGEELAFSDVVLISINDTSITKTLLEVIKDTIEYDGLNISLDLINTKLNYLFYSIN